MKLIFPTRRYLSTSPSKQSSPLPWISPLQLLKSSRKPDPPPENGNTPIETRKRQKFTSHESFISSIKHERDPQKALEIFNKISEQKGFEHNSATYAVILEKLAQTKNFLAIDSVLHRMKYETCKFHEGIFLNLMKHFSRHSLHERVLDMFNAIQTIVRQKPSLKAISTCLNLIVESNQVEFARNFLIDLRNNLHLEPNTCIFNILVKYHCKKGNLEAAFQVLEEMKKSKISYPNLITYSTLMDGLCKSERTKGAIDLFEEMVAKDNIVPDALTYNILINCFCHGRQVDRAKKIIEFMKKNGCNPNIYNYSALINGFCKEGRLEEAKDAFKEMKLKGLKPDKVVYTAYINSFCKAMRVDEAIELLKEMKENNCKADIVTFNVIIKGLCGEGRIEEALAMVYKLPKEGVYLSKASYRIVLNFLLKESDLENAIELLGLMLSRKFVPHFATSNELLVHLCENGRSSDAYVALFGLVELGFKPEPNSWSLLVDLVCRERRFLSVFELMDELVAT